jgi:large subunit ribosomal protein L22
MMREKTGYRAVARGLPMSAKKVRPLADHLRRRSYPEAVSILENLPHKGARLLEKVIKSAAANALYTTKQLDESSLFIKELLIDEGRQEYRVWPRARGRADRLIKRSCHISVTLDVKGELK